MKIKTNNSIYNIALLEDRAESIKIRVSLDDDLSTIIDAIENTTAIDYLADDETTLIFKVAGVFTLDTVSRSKEFYVLNFKKVTKEVTRIEALEAENIELKNQITALELAMVEIYESMEV